MRYRRLNPVGDMTFGSSQNNFLRDIPEAVAQAVVTRLKLWLGEWFLDVAEGTPYVQAVLGKYTAQTLGPAMRQRILETRDVTGIVEFDFQIDPNERSVSIQAMITTAYGAEKINEVI